MVPSITGAANIPRQGGVYKLPDGNPISVGSVASSVTMNSTLDDIGDEISASIPRDGSAAALANLPMGGFKHTGVGNATLRNHYGAVGQIQDGAFELIRSVAGDATTMTGALLPNIPAAPVDGQKIVFVPTNTNSSGSGTTLNINGTGPIILARVAGVSHIRVADIVAGQPAFLIFNAAFSQWVLINPRSPVLFSDLGGTIANAQVPVGAVTQHVGSLILSSMAGQVTNAQVPIGAVSQWSSAINIGTFGGTLANAQVVASNVTQHVGSLILSSMAGQVTNAQVPASAVSQHFVTSAESVTLPGGAIFKWGSHQFGDLSSGFGTNQVGIVFAVAFPNACLQVVLGKTGSSTAAIPYANSLAVGGFTLGMEEFTSVVQGSNNTATWFAIGN
jgi:hypothetical protein